MAMVVKVIKTNRWVVEHFDGRTRMPVSMQFKRCIWIDIIVLIN